MVLDQTLHLQVTGSSSASTSEPDVHISYIDYTPDGKQTPPLPARAQLNGPADVTVLSAPVNNVSREIQYFSVFNKYTGDRTITVKTDDGTTERMLFRVASLSAGRAIVFVNKHGWEVQ